MTKTAKRVFKYTFYKCCRKKNGKFQKNLEKFSSKNIVSSSKLGLLTSTYPSGTLEILYIFL